MMQREQSQGLHPSVQPYPTSTSQLGMPEQLHPQHLPHQLQQQQQQQLYPRQSLSRHSTSSQRGGALHESRSHATLHPRPSHEALAPSYAPSEGDVEMSSAGPSSREVLGLPLLHPGLEEEVGATPTGAPFSWTPPHTAFAAASLLCPKPGSQHAYQPHPHAQPHGAFPYSASSRPHKRSSLAGSPSGASSSGGEGSAGSYSAHAQPQAPQHYQTQRAASIHHPSRLSTLPHTYRRSPLQVRCT